MRIKSFTADPLAITAYGPPLAADGRRLALTQVRPAGSGAPDLLVARVEGVTTREAAEALNRMSLFVERERLGPPEDEDEFFAADLIGLPVQDEAGHVLGTIVGVPNYGGGDLLEIAPAGGGPSALLPFTKAFVPAVDLAQNRVLIAPPDGLFDETDPHA